MSTASFKASSTSFQDGATLEAKYAHTGVTSGKNISPAVAWTDAPKGARSFAISVVDPHPVAQNWVHWLVADIPANVTGLSEGASLKSMPTGSRELKTSYGTVGYGGPQPPKGSGKHPYVFTVYALNVPHLEVGENITLQEFQAALKDKGLASAQITGYFER